MITSSAPAPCPTPGFEQPGIFDPVSVCDVLFRQLLDQEVNRLTKQSIVLDIGCGSGIGRRADRQEKIANQVQALWGVEPDQEVQPAACVTRVWKSTLEDADIPEESVDLAYSFMVLEHVENATAFLQKLGRSLKPGGVHFSATINAQCFFARVARITSKLGIQAQVLYLAKGRKALDDYHYPAVYHMNTRARLQQLATDAGFSRVEVLTVDSDEWFHYFPKPIRKLCGRVARATFQRHVDTFPYMFVKMVK